MLAHQSACANGVESPSHEREFPQRCRAAGWPLRLATANGVDSLRYLTHQVAGLEHLLTSSARGARRPSVLCHLDGWSNNTWVSRAVPEPIPPYSVRSAQLTARRLAVNGEPWLVYELRGPSFDRRSAPSLVFEGEDAVRRVRDFPADWRTLSDDELFALSWTV